MKWKPVDVISILIILGCFILLILGHDGNIKLILLVVVGLYYGIDLTPFIRLGRVIKHHKQEGSNGE